MKSFSRDKNETETYELILDVDSPDEIMDELMRLTTGGDFPRTCAWASCHGEGGAL